MEKKLNIEELEKQYLEAEKNFKKLKEQFNEAKKVEEEAKKAKLEAEKQARYDAVIEAYKQFEKLRTEYVDDYGRFTFERKSRGDNLNDWVLASLGLI